ncbi:MAG: DUF3857 domain-containing protein [Bacteroidales bacterium]|nr:DUF3857 domain-containing protein [Bacteroidales bacterium]
MNYHIEIRINNKDGQEYAKRYFAYFSDSEKPYDLKAYIIGPNGKTIQKLRSREVKTIDNVSLNNSFYEDSKLMGFYMSQNEFPYTLVYSYDKNVSNYFRIPLLTNLYRDIPTKKIIATVDLPRDFPVRYETQHMDSVRVDTTENEIHFRFVGHYTNTTPTEYLAPPASYFDPEIRVIPEYFKYGIRHSQKTWKDFGQWQYDLLEFREELPENEKQKISQLIKGVTDTTEKIKILYHYLQDETRYVNVAIQHGRLTPKDASYVAQNKYGDCKALSNYFRAVLSYAGISSDYTIINAGSKIDTLDRRLPFTQFNHAILYVPRKDTSSLWLDCTSKYAFGYLGTFTQNRYALVTENNNSHLLHTPALKPADVLTTRRISLTYKLIQNWTAIDINNTYRGPAYQELASFKRFYNGSVKEKIMKFFIPNAVMESYDLNLVNRDSAKIQLQFKAHSNKTYVKYGQDILVRNIALSIPDLEKPSKRKLPVQINFPIYKIDSIRYNIPYGYRISSIKKDTTLVTSFGTYESKISTTDSSFVVTKNFLLKPGTYPLRSYPALYRFLNTASKNEHKFNVLLTKKNQ